MLLQLKKNFLCCNQLTFRSLVKYSTITFCLANKPVSLSFSFDPTNNPSVPASRHTIQHRNLPFLIHRGGSKGTMKLSSSTAPDVLISVPSTPGEKLNKLRSKMKELKLDAYIIPSDDPHLSEYVPEAYMRRKFLCGFGGSAGTALVLENTAFLWTDSRYYNEANIQLDADHWVLMKQGLPNVPSLTKYVSDIAVEHFLKTQETFRVGIDPFVHPASFAHDMNDAFTNAVKLSDIDDKTSVGEIDTLDGMNNLIDDIWGDQRPSIPTSQFRVHPLEYAGMSVIEKVESIRKEMFKKKATLSVFTTLDDVAYLFNVRATGDIATCPVGIGYGSVTMDGISIYCDQAKVQSEEIQSHFKDSGVTIKSYDNIIDEIKDHILENENAKVWIDQSRSNYALTRLIPESKLIGSQNAVTPMKAQKNSAEMAGMKRAHVVDGAAMAHFISWLENAIVNEGRSVSEVEIDEVLRGFRSEQPGYIEDSFPTIAGVGSNGAIIHYRAKEDSDILKYLDQSNPILIDSGGQYSYGTTDVTRTWHFGNATNEFIENYTRVLKGNIGVDSMQFPMNTPGFVLDVFARKSLWEAQLDYGHGTGHGVGAALNVHEGPMSISPRWTNKETMKKGMVVSNEPGLYEDGRFGIRIENLLETTYVNEEDNEAYDNGWVEGDEGYPEKSPGKKTFLKFNKLTMIPIQKNLIDLRLMTESELDWLDSYHREVYDNVSPLLENGSPALAWLEKSCQKIERS